jgi:hypothetical protein
MIPFDITDLSPHDVARLADSPLGEALLKTDSELFFTEFNMALT